MSLHTLLYIRWGSLHLRLNRDNRHFERDEVIVPSSSTVSMTLVVDSVCALHPASGVINARNNACEHYRARVGACPESEHRKGSGTSACRVAQAHKQHSRRNRRRVCSPMVRHPHISARPASGRIQVAKEWDASCNRTAARDRHESRWDLPCGICTIKSS